MKGTSYAVGNSFGISVEGSSLITSGAGAIDMQGVGGSTSSSGSKGIVINTSLLEPLTSKGRPRCQGYVKSGSQCKCQGFGGNKYCKRHENQL
jgi:hypothetical protein